MFAAALICTAIAAIANWSTRVWPREWLETVSKPLATTLVIWVAIAAKGPHTPTVLAVIGLVCCLAGDVALLDVVDRFVVGLAAFLIGHLVFAAMFVTLHLRHPLWGL
ncbi:MAG TPA: lysoplasmalogenase family protein, partial [Ilumatobacteraceae bacterium]